MENAHLIIPEPEEQYETLPPKWCLEFLALMFIVFVILGILIVNAWAAKVDDLQTKLLSSQLRAEELQKSNSDLESKNEALMKENATLKCEAYFYAD